MAKPFKTSEPPKNNNNAIFALAVFWLLVIFGFFAGSGALKIFDPLKLLFQVRDYFAPIFEKNLWWLELLSVTLSLLFLWGIAYILRKTGYFLDVKGEDALDLLGGGYKHKVRILRIWWKIKKQLDSSEPSQWKKAILETDDVLNEIFKMSGYLGSQLEEKLETIPSRAPRALSISSAGSASA